MSIITINIKADSELLKETNSLINENSHLLSQIGIKIMALQEDVDLLTAQVNKVMTEIVNAKQALLDQIAALEAQIANNQPVDLTALKAAVQAIDDINPDVVV